MDSGSNQRSVLYIAALLSVLAAVMHVLVVPEHLAEWWGYGAFFIATVITQAALAPALLHWPRRSVLVAGIVGNLVIAAMWFVSRSLGVPLVGPGAGELEPVGALDVVCSAVEIALVALLVIAAWSGERQSQQNRAGYDAAITVRAS